MGLNSHFLTPLGRVPSMHAPFSLCGCCTLLLRGGPSHLPRAPCTGWKPHLCVGLQEVVEHIHRDGEVPGVEGVGAIPSLGPKLSSFGHHPMKVTESKEDALKLRLPGAHLQGVLKGKCCP